MFQRQMSPRRREMLGHAVQLHPLDLGDEELVEPGPRDALVGVEQRKLRPMRFEVRQEERRLALHQAVQLVQHGIGLVRATQLPKRLLMHDGHAQPPLHLVVRDHGRPRALDARARLVQAVALVGEARRDARLDVAPLLAQQQREVAFQLPHAARLQRQIGVVQVAAVHVGQVVRERRDVRGQPLGREPLDEPAERAEVLHLLEDARTMVHAVGQKRVLHEPRVGTRDARQVAVHRVHVALEQLASAGQVGVPRSQDVQRWAFLERALGNLVHEERVQEVGVLGDVAAVVLEQEQQQIGIDAAVVAAFHPEPQRAGVVAVLAVVRGGRLAQLRAVDAVGSGLLAQEILEQMMVTVRIAMQAAEERVCAVEFVHDGAGVGTPRQQPGELRVELVHHRRAQAELPQVEVPRVPHLRLEVAGEQVVAAAGIDLARLRHRGHADGPALRRREGEARLLGREGTPQAFEVAPDLVLGEAQLVGPDELRRIAHDAAQLVGQLVAGQQKHRERPGQPLEHGRQRLHDLAVRDEVHVVQHERVALGWRLHLGQHHDDVLDGRRGKRRAREDAAHAHVLRLHRQQARGQQLEEHGGRVVVAIEADPHHLALARFQPQQRRNGLAAARRSPHVAEPQGGRVVEPADEAAARRAHLGQRRGRELLAQHERAVDGGFLVHGFDPSFFAYGASIVLSIAKAIGGTSGKPSYRPMFSLFRCAYRDSAPLL